MKPLTGRNAFAITAAAFGSVIAVNLTLAVAAVGRFPGLVVKNAYLASQSFDAERQAQEALGRQVTAEHAGGVLEFDVTGAQGAPAEAAELAARVGRATPIRDDLGLELLGDDGRFTATAPLLAGQWTLQLDGRAQGGTAIRQDPIFFVKG